MGKTIPNPKYNLISARLDDELYEWVCKQPIAKTRLVEMGLRRLKDENSANYERT